MREPTESEPPPKRLVNAVDASIFLALFLVFAPVVARAPEMPPEKPILYLRANTYLVGQKPLKAQVLASAGDLDFSFDRLRYRKLISCLAKHESNYNPQARGASGEVGILQFMPATFASYCEGDINNPQAQIECCDKMLSEDLNNVYLWATAKFCL